jgi:hypothetical protein
MKTKLALKVAGLIGVLALISAGYCFWLMTVPLSYHWVPVVLTGFVVAIGVFVISLITSLSCSHDCVDHLMHRILRKSGRPANLIQGRFEEVLGKGGSASPKTINAFGERVSPDKPAQPPVTYAKGIH